MIQFNLEISKDTTYSELKEWFVKNFDDLPTTLDVTGKYYKNVPELIELWTTQIESEIERCKTEKISIKGSSLARDGKNGLKQLYYELQDFDAWNVAHKDVDLKK